jgi:hypothetical protein
MVIRDSGIIARHKTDLLDLIDAMHMHDMGFRTVVERRRDRAIDNEYVDTWPPTTLNF